MGYFRLNDAVKRVTLHHEIWQLFIDADDPKPSRVPKVGVGRRAARFRPVIQRKPLEGPSPGELRVTS